MWLHFNMVFLRPPTALGEVVSLSLMYREVGYEQLLQVSCACSPAAGIIRNVTLMGISGFSRERRDKLQAQPIWKKNGSVQEVLFTTCAQKGTVCQIFIPTGLVYKSWAADVGEPPLSLPGSAKGCWIKRESCTQIASTQSLTATLAAFAVGILSPWMKPPCFQCILLSILLMRKIPAFLIWRQEMGRPGRRGRSSRGIQWATGAGAEIAVPHVRGGKFSFQSIAVFLCADRFIICSPWMLVHNKEKWDQKGIFPPKMLLFIWLFMGMLNGLPTLSGWSTDGLQPFQRCRLVESKASDMDFWSRMKCLPGWKSLPLLGLLHYSPALQIVGSRRWQWYLFA